MSDRTNVQHHEVEELLGAYALDAVEPDEAALVEAHLATCPRCRAEVDGHREVATFLAQAGAPAPEHLWDRIADAIGGESPPPMRLVVDREPRAARLRWFGGGAAVAAAAAAVVVAIVGVGSESSDGAELRDLALSAFEAPDASMAELVGSGGELVARAAVLPDGSGYVLAG